MWGTRVLLGGVTALLLAGVLSLSATAAAGPSLAATPASGLPGASLSLGGSGFRSGVGVAMCWDGPGCSDLGTAVPNASGTFSRTVSIPGDANPGEHDIWACQDDPATSTDCALVATTSAKVTVATTTTTATSPPTTSSTTSTSTTTTTSSTTTTTIPTSVTTTTRPAPPATRPPVPATTPSTTPATATTVTPPESTTVPSTDTTSPEAGFIDGAPEVTAGDRPPATRAAGRDDKVIVAAPSQADAVSLPLLSETAPSPAWPRLTAAVVLAGVVAALMTLTWRRYIR